MRPSASSCRSPLAAGLRGVTGEAVLLGQLNDIVAFEVDDLESALLGQELLIAPNGPTKGVLVAFVLVDGAPVEFLQFLK